MTRPLSRLVPVAVAVALSACAAPGSLVVPPLPTNVEDPGPRERLRIVTYNVHWRSTHAGPREVALLAELRAADADVIAIQELGTWFAEALDASGFVRDGGYAATSVGGETVAPHRLLLLTRFPIRSTLIHAFSWGDSSAVVTRLEVNGRTIAVANVHLESRLNRQKARVRQLEEVLALLGDEEAILLGDFNFGDGEEPESSALPAAFADAWLEVNPGDPGITWSRERNGWADRNSYEGEPSRRLDRILIRSDRLEPEEAALLGVERTADGRFPSDHFGLAVTLRDRGAPLFVPPGR